jgi:hypothetical protein
MKTKQKIMRLWLAQNDDNFVVSKKIPTMNPVTGWINWPGPPYYEFCRKHWLAITGLRVRPNYCVPIQVRQTKTGFTFWLTGKPRKMMQEPNL